MKPRIKILGEKKLIGVWLTMSLTENNTFDLWSNFMPRRNEIKAKLSSDLFSMQVYDASYDFKNFNTKATFKKWAAVEVADFENVPDTMETFILESGLYAVFIHKGAASEGEKTFRFIFETWLPNSDYVLDNRPHFELLGVKYKNNDPASEEEIWIPVKLK